MDQPVLHILGRSWDFVFSGPIVWPSNSCLLRRDIVPETVYLLDEGIIKMIHITVDGDERVVDIRQAPALIGAAFALAHCPSIVDFLTVTKCSLRWCSAEQFLSASANDAARAADVLRWECAEIVRQCDRAVAMSLKTPWQRLSHFISQYGLVSADHDAPPELPFKQSLVASCINVTPEHLSRLMRKRADARHAQRPRESSPHPARKLNP